MKRIRKFNYLDKQDKCGLKVGDVVKIIKIAKSHEKGWENTWVSDMNKEVGKTFTIRYFHKTRGIGLVWSCYEYPFFVLKKI